MSTAEELTTRRTKMDAVIRVNQYLVCTGIILFAGFLVLYYGNVWEHTEARDYQTYIGLVLFSMVQAIVTMKIISAWFMTDLVETASANDEKKLAWLTILAAATTIASVVAYNHLDHQFPLFGAS